MDRLEDQMGGAANVAVTLVTTYGLRVVGAIVILLVGWMASRLVYGAVARLCEKSPRLDRTVALFLGNGARYTVLVFTFVAVLTTFGIATTSFVAVLGALGIAIGLALQGTLSNLAAGIMLVLFRPFHVGDRIETGGVSGVTRVINLFYTEVDSDTGARIIIPNGKLWGEIVSVPGHDGRVPLDLHYTRPASEGVDTAIARLRDLLQGDRRVLDVTGVGIDSIDDGSYTLAARVWVRQSEAMAVRFDINRAVKQAFERPAPPPAPAVVERRAG